MELLAAADAAARHVPDLVFRFVNVVDLMRLSPAADHPHGLTSGEFAELFTDDTDVVFAFHGYPEAVHGLVHGQSDADRFHVRGYREQGTTTTPFDMVVLNEMSRYHLATEVLRRARRIPPGATELAELLPRPARAPPRLRPRAPRGHARDPRLDLGTPSTAQCIVLCVNAGSSSLKLALFEVDPGRRSDRASASGGDRQLEADARHGTEPASPALAELERRGLPGSPPPSATGSCTAGPTTSRPS